jgi:large conductance mechanosensitive channel
MKNFVEEFKAFALKGNVLDLAIGVVIGTAFNKIVDSLVNDIVMQAIAAIFKQPDFSTIAWHVNGGAIKFGAFINNIVNFLVVAVSVFIAIKAINKLSTMKVPVVKVPDIKVPFIHKNENTDSK